VAFPLVFGNGAGTAWIFEVSTVWVKLIANHPSFLWVLSLSQSEQSAQDLLLV